MEGHRVVFIVEWLLKGDVHVHPLTLIKLDNISESSYQDICHINPLTLALPNLVTGSFVAGRIEAIPIPTKQLRCWQWLGQTI